MKSIAILLFTAASLSADVQATNSKRTLQQLVDLAMNRGAKKEIPGLLAHDLGISRSFVRRRIVIDDGKSEPRDALSVVCKLEEGRLVPAGLLWQEATPKGDGAYDARNYYTSLAGELKSVTLSKIHEENGSPMATEKTASVDEKLWGLLAAEMKKFLMADKADIQGQ